MLRGVARCLRRSARACLHSTIGSIVPTSGLNLGGGDWWRPGWKNLDCRHAEGGRLTAETLFPFADASLAYVFSSHFFEHIDDVTAQHLLGEAYRVLRAGGICRIAVPDFELALMRYRAGDHAFFDGGSWGMSPRYENWAAHGVAATLENKLAYVFSGYANRHDGGRFPPWRYDAGYYCGPPAVAGDAVRAMAVRGSISELSDWLRGCIPSVRYDTGHINWYDEAKLRAMIMQAGFSSCRRSAYRASAAPALRGPAFDNRPDISLYIEAVK